MAHVCGILSIDEVPMKSAMLQGRSITFVRRFISGGDLWFLCFVGASGGKCIILYH